ncbi:hypothetical protein B5X24_HaOG216068 [Helicoverpa armigera]|nr:hypothetical protein B5X24_HaOG216068 [Helicoverpa armigera]
MEFVAEGGRRAAVGRAAGRAARSDTSEASALARSASSRDHGCAFGTNSLRNVSHDIVDVKPSRFIEAGSFITKIRDNISSWVLWWRQRHLRMGAPQTPKPIEEDDCVPRVAVVEDIREVQQDRKVDRRRAAPGPRRRGLENELEGERRRPRRKPRKR